LRIANGPREFSSLLIQLNFGCPPRSSDRQSSQTPINIPLKPSEHARQHRTSRFLKIVKVLLLVNSAATLAACTDLGSQTTALLKSQKYNQMHTAIVYYRLMAYKEPGCCLRPSPKSCGSPAL
jgi:hypothetical protein